MSQNFIFQRLTRFFLFSTISKYAPLISTSSFCIGLSLLAGSVCVCVVFVKCNRERDLYAGTLSARYVCLCVALFCIFGDLVEPFMIRMVHRSYRLDAMVLMGIHRRMIQTSNRRRRHRRRSIVVIVGIVRPE